MPRCAKGCCPSPAEHFRSLSFGTEKSGVVNRKDYALAADMAAYKALRRQGFQPPRVEGSYDLCRRATSEAEIRLGQVIDERDARVKRRGTKLMEGMLEIADHGMVGKIPDKGGKKRLPMKAKR